MLNTEFTVQVGTTSKRITIFVTDSSQTDNRGLTGLAWNTANLVWWYWREDTGNNGGVQVTLATATRGTWTSGGFVEIDSANLPGWYEIGLPNAIIAAGAATWAIIMLKGATNMQQTELRIRITAVNLDDGVRFGMTALPNAAAQAGGGLFTRGIGAGQINQAANGQIDVNAVTLNGTALTARDIGASVLLSSGTGAGQLNFTSGVVNANLVQILATALTETPGQIAAAFKNFFNVGAPTLTCLDINQTGDSFARLGAPANASVSADIAAVKSDTAGIANVPTANANADALLKRDWTLVSGEAARSVLNALRFLRNKWAVSGTTLTVYKEDSATTAWTGTVTTNSSAAPITGDTN